jgi:hypothetical protein
MEQAKKMIENASKELEQLILGVAVIAKSYRNYPHFETGDKLDRALVYLQAARVQLHRARSELC